MTEPTAAPLDSVTSARRAQDGAQLQALARAEESGALPATDRRAPGADELNALSADAPLADPAARSEVTAIARVCHEANRAFCRTIGDDSQQPWEDAPEWQRESAFRGVLAVARGEVRSPGDSHVSWTAEKVRTGWVYGPVKNAEAKTHPCLVPFDQLPREQQAKDHLFLAVASALLGGATAPAAEPEPVTFRGVALQPAAVSHLHELLDRLPATDAAVVEAIRAELPPR